MPVWHASISAWSRRKVRQDQPAICERQAVKLLRGVGGDREWWFFNPQMLIGHLRVAVTGAEHEGMPQGCAVHDAGESGPERARIR
jgi:hypothetical protein